MLNVRNALTFLFLFQPLRLSHVELLVLCDSVVCPVLTAALHLVGALAAGRRGSDGGCCARRKSALLLKLLLINIILLLKPFLLYSLVPHRPFIHTAANLLTRLATPLHNVKLVILLCDLRNIEIRQCN